MQVKVINKVDIKNNYLPFKRNTTFSFHEINACAYKESLNLHA